MRSILILAGSLIISSACAQQPDTADTTLYIPLIESDSPAFPEPAVQSKGIAIEIFKLTSNKSYIIAKDKFVRVWCNNTKKGNLKIKRARLTDISGHQMTFSPTDKNYDEITYNDSTLTYIEFVTTGTVARGIVVNTLLISVILVAVVASSYIGGNIPLDDFHKHIQFYSSKRGRKWGIRTIEVKPLQLP